MPFALPAPFSSEILWLTLLALLVDLTIGDPRWLPHPVVALGRLIAWLDKLWNHGSERARRIKGIVLAVVVVVLAWSLTALVLALAARVNTWLALVVEVLLLATCLAAHGLVAAAREVFIPLRRGDLVAARQAVAALVGRDTRELDEAGVARACVESVAENTVDGITAPLFWALVGGAPMAMAYKAVNTLDSMVGYRNERYTDFGWASARLDDIANWLPARVTAFAMWLTAPVLLSGYWRRTRMHLWKEAWRATCREAPRHPSPNSGWPEAMVANLLGIQLGGRNVYGNQVSERARLGRPLQTLHAGHIQEAILCLHAGTIGVVVMLVIAAPMITTLLQAVLAIWRGGAA
uniref:adenosylcobinamide-phosphate synthase CbiB n=1 Tax=Halomonas sp. TaxID=1486246 RepID=UPI00260AC46D|nr:adenosylcobinamide-phosphate synthase CbiB [Halomonas sp.]